MLTLAIALYWTRKIWNRCVLLALSISLACTAAQAADLSGSWEGKWQSCTDRFHGTVRATITHCGGCRYEAVFTGRAFKVMPYRYKATLFAWTDPASGKKHFKSTRKIPLWGSYWMNGSVDDCCFNARYRTDDHTGIFTMRRVSN